jgi:hypothetical protein
MRGLGQSLAVLLEPLGSAPAHVVLLGPIAALEEIHDPSENDQEIHPRSPLYYPDGPNLWPELWTSGRILCGGNVK